MVLLPVMHVH